MSYSKYSDENNLPEFVSSIGNVNQTLIPTSNLVKFVISGSFLSS